MRLLFALPLLLAAAPVPAPDMLDAATARAVLDGCVATAAAKKQNQAVAVVDAGGHVVASLRMDGSAWGSMDYAVAKAVAASAWGFSTAGMEAGAKAAPAFGDAPHVVPMPGGVPIYAADGGRLLGAIGVSGASPADDAACAEAGVKAAGLRTSRG